MKIRQLNYNLEVNNKQLGRSQKGFGRSGQMQIQQQGYETSGSVGMTDRRMSVPLRGAYLNTKMAKTSKAAPYAVISFGKKNQNHYAFVGAELPPYCKIGGVATVMNDYKDMFTHENDRQVMIMPYYNGKVCCDEQDQPTGKFEVRKLPAGTKDKNGNDISGHPYYTNADRQKESEESIIKSGKFWELELVGEADAMSFGLNAKEPIALYQVKGTNHFMVFTQATASMPTAYSKRTEVGAGKSAPSHYSSGSSGGLKEGWNGDPYAAFSKAFVQLLPKIEKTYTKKGEQETTSFEPGTVICSDSQTAFIPHYMARESENKDSYYDDDIKPTYVAHNLGQGYISGSSYKEMYINLGASVEDLKKIQEDSNYSSAVKNGEEEKYFKNLIANSKEDRNVDIADDTGFVSGVMVPIHYAEQGYIPMITTVSEDYAQDLVENPAVSPGLQKHLKKLYDQGKFRGILNALNDPNLDPNKRLGLMGYGYAIFEVTEKDGDKPKQVTSKELAAKVLKNDTEYQNMLKDSKRKKDAEEKFESTAKEIEALSFDETDNGSQYGYSKIKKTANALSRYSNLKDGKGEVTDDMLGKEWDNIQKAKAENKFRLIDQHLNKDGNTNSLVLTGLNGRNVKQIGALDLKTITAGLSGSDDVDKLKQCHLTVSWGRGDLQKGLDTTMKAWAKAAELDKNAFLVLGGELPPDGDEYDRITKAIDQLNSKFKGRFVFMNGFAPGVALSMAADTASFPSRFAPCELTDLEAMHYGVTPIVTNCQGLKQKNFDPDIDPNLSAEKQTSFKTLHQFFMTTDVLRQYDDDMEKAIAWLNTKKDDFNDFLEKDSKDGHFEYKIKRDDGSAVTAEDIINSREKILTAYDEEHKGNKNDKDVVRELLSVSYEFKTTGFKKYDDTEQDKTLKAAAYEADKDDVCQQRKNTVLKTLKDSVDYQKMVRAARDAIVENELAMAMIRSQAAIKNTEKHKKLFKNAISLNTKFNGNAALHPAVDGKQLSTLELYEKWHIKNKSVREGKKLHTYAPEIEKAKNSEPSSLIEKIKAGWKELSKGSKIGIVVGASVATAAAIGGGIWAGIAANKKKQAAEAAKAEADYDDNDNYDDEADYDDLDIIEE